METHDRRRKRRTLREQNSLERASGESYFSSDPEAGKGDYPSSKRDIGISLKSTYSDRRKKTSKRRSNLIRGKGETIKNPQVIRALCLGGGQEVPTARMRS